MDYDIPITYKLHMYDVYDKISYNYDNKIVIINNFNLHINKDCLIYKITSDIPLENLLDFLFKYKNKTIKKIYYFLIIKYLFKHSFIIKTEYKFCCFNKKNIYEEICFIENYLICNNDKIIILTMFLSNIFLIINNKSINKSLICRIDNNNNNNNDIYILINKIKHIHSNNFEDICVYLIGDNINIIIHIYHILKKIKLSKYIYKTYINYIEPFKVLKYKSYKDKLTFL